MFSVRPRQLAPSALATPSLAPSPYTLVTFLRFPRSSIQTSAPTFSITALPTLLSIHRAHYPSSPAHVTTAHSINRVHINCSEPPSPATQQLHTSIADSITAGTHQLLVPSHAQLPSSQLWLHNKPVRSTDRP